MNDTGKNVDDRLKRLLIVIAYMLVFAGIVYILNVLKPVLIFILKIIKPFLLALILAYFFDPIVTFVQKRLKLPRITGLIIFYILIILIISLFLLLILPEVFKQTITLFKTLKDILPEKIRLLQERFNIKISEADVRKFIEKLNIEEIQIEKVANTLMPGLKSVAVEGVSAAGNIALGVASGIGSLFSLLSFLIFVLIINFYFLLDFSRIMPFVEKLFPEERVPELKNLFKKLDKAVGGFLRGQTIDCALVGVLTAIALLIMGFKKYAILLGFITGVGNAIPYLGPLLGGIPSFIWILVSSSYPDTKSKLVAWGILILIFAVIQAIDGLIFQPKIVGKNSQLHPLVVLLALFIGAHFGISGMIVAIPVACIIRVLIKELWWGKFLEKKKAT